MTKSISKFALALLFAAVTTGLTTNVSAQDTKPGKEPAAKSADAAKEGKAARIPFRGTIASVDETAKTIKVGERVFHVTANTKIMKEGHAATFADAKAGEEVGGQYQKTEDGKMELTSLRLGKKVDADADEAKEPKAPKPKKEAPAQ